MKFIVTRLDVGLSTSFSYYIDDHIKDSAHFCTCNAEFMKQVLPMFTSPHRPGKGWGKTVFQHRFPKFIKLLQTSLALAVLVKLQVKRAS
jgi:hypothetical protein